MRKILEGIMEILSFIGQFARKLRTGMASRRVVAALLAVMYVGSLVAPSAALAATVNGTKSANDITEASTVASGASLRLTGGTLNYGLTILGTLVFEAPVTLNADITSSGTICLMGTSGTFNLTSGARHIDTVALNLGMSNSSPSTDKITANSSLLNFTRMVGYSQGTGSSNLAFNYTVDTNKTFVNSVGNSGGAAMYLGGGTYNISVNTNRLLTFADSFSGATGTGSAIYLRTDTSGASSVGDTALTLKGNVDFVNNVVCGNGAAMVIGTNDSEAKHVTVTLDFTNGGNVNFINNMTRQTSGGGAIRTYKGQNLVINSNANFLGNKNGVTVTTAGSDASTTLVSYSGGTPNDLNNSGNTTIKNFVTTMDGGITGASGTGTLTVGDSGALGATLRLEKAAGITGQKTLTVNSDGTLDMSETTGSISATSFANNGMLNLAGGTARNTAFTGTMSGTGTIGFDLDLSNLSSVSGDKITGGTIGGTITLAPNIIGAPTSKPSAGGSYQLFTGTTSAAINTTKVASNVATYTLTQDSSAKGKLNIAVGAGTTLPAAARDSTISSYVLVKDEKLSDNITNSTNVLPDKVFTLSSNVGSKGEVFTVDGNGKYGFILKNSHETLNITSGIFENFTGASGASALIHVGTAPVASAVTNVNIGSDAGITVFRNNNGKSTGNQGSLIYNLANGNSGANANANLTFDGKVVFANNTDSGSGSHGVISNHKAGSGKALTYFNGETLFLNNTAASGAIYLLGGSDGCMVYFNGTTVFKGNKNTSGSGLDITYGDNRVYVNGNTMMDGGFSGSGYLNIDNNATLYVGGIKSIGETYDGTNFTSSEYNVNNYYADSSISSAALTSARALTIAAGSMLDMRNTTGNLNSTELLSNSGSLRMGSGSITAVAFENNGVLDLTNPAKNTVTVSGNATLNGEFTLGYDLGSTTPNTTDIISVTGTAGGEMKFTEGYVTGGSLSVGSVKNLNVVFTGANNITSVSGGYALDTYGHEYTLTPAKSGTMVQVSVKRLDHDINLYRILTNDVFGPTPYQPGVVSTYTLSKNIKNQDSEMWYFNGGSTNIYTTNLGTLTPLAGESTREFTINGAGYNIDGNAKGGITVGTGNTLNIKNTTFTNFKGTSDGGTINAINAVVNLQDGTKFENNTGSSRGTAAYVHSGSLTAGGNVAFYKNTATSLGGALFVHNNALASFTGNTVFRENTGSEGGAIFVHGSGSCTTIGGTSVFFGNKRTAGTGSDITLGEDAALNLYGNVLMDGGIVLSSYGSKTQTLNIGDGTTANTVYLGKIKYTGTAAADVYNVSKYAQDTSAKGTAGIASSASGVFDVNVRNKATLDMSNSTGNLNATSLTNSGTVKMGSGTYNVTTTPTVNNVGAVMTLTGTTIGGGSGSVKTMNFQNNGTITFENINGDMAQLRLTGDGGTAGSSTGVAYFKNTGSTKLTYDGTSRAGADYCGVAIYNREKELRVNGGTAGIEFTNYSGKSGLSLDGAGGGVLYNTGTSAGDSVVYIDGNVTFSNSKVTGTANDVGGGAIANRRGDGHKGIMYIGTLDSNSLVVFKDNSVGNYDGGAILNSGDLYFGGETRFIGNDAKWGAGICNFGGSTITANAGSKLVFTGNGGTNSSRVDIHSNGTLTVLGDMWMDKGISGSDTLRSGTITIGDGTTANTVYLAALKTNTAGAYEVDTAATGTAYISNHKTLTVNEKATLDMQYSSGDLQIDDEIINAGTIKIGSGTVGVSKTKAATAYTNTGTTYLYGTKLATDINTSSTKVGTVYVSNNNESGGGDFVDNTTSPKNIYAKQVIVQTGATLNSSANNLLTTDGLQVCGTDAVMNLNGGEISGLNVAAQRSPIEVLSGGTLNTTGDLTISGNTSTAEFGSGAMHISGGTANIGGNSFTVINNTSSTNKGSGVIGVEGGGVLNISAATVRFSGNVGGKDGATDRSNTVIDLYSYSTSATANLTGADMEFDGELGIGAHSGSYDNNNKLTFGDGTNASAAKFKNGGYLRYIKDVDINNNATVTIGSTGNITSVTNFNVHTGGTLDMSGSSGNIGSITNFANSGTIKTGTGTYSSKLTNNAGGLVEIAKAGAFTGEIVNGGTVNATTADGVGALQGTITNTGTVNLLGTNVLNTLAKISGGTLNIGSEGGAAGEGDIVIAAKASQIAAATTTVFSGDRLDLGNGVLGGKVTGEGTLKIVGNNVEAQADYVDAAVNTVDESAKLILTGGTEGKTFTKDITGDGEVVIKQGTSETEQNIVNADAMVNTKKLTISQYSVLNIDVDRFGGGFGDAGLVNNGTIGLTANGNDEDAALYPDSTDTLQATLTGDGKYLFNAGDGRKIHASADKIQGTGENKIGTGTLDLTDGTLTQALIADTTPGDVEISGTVETQADITGLNVVVDAGKTLNVTAGTISGGSTGLTNNGTTNVTTGTVSSNVTNNDTLTLNGSGEISGNVVNNAAGTYTITAGTQSGTVANEGVFLVNGGAVTGAVSNGKTMNITGGAVSGGIINNASGTVLITGGEISGAEVTNAHRFIVSNGTVSAAVTNSADMTIAGGNVTGGITNTGTVNVQDDSTAPAGTALSALQSAIANNGTLNLNSEGTLNSAAVITGGSGSSVSVMQNVTATAAQLLGSMSLAISDGKTLTLTGTGTLGSGIALQGTGSSTGILKNTGVLDVATILNYKTQNEGTLTVDADKLQNKLENTDTATLNLGAGTLGAAAEISGGTVNINGAVKAAQENFNATNKVANLNIAAAGMLDLVNNKRDTIEIGGDFNAMTAGAAIGLDVNLSGFTNTETGIANAKEVVNGSTGEFDSIVVGGNATGVVNLGSVNVLKVPAASDMEIGAYGYLKVIDAAGTNNVTFDESVTVTSDGAKYDFRQAKDASDAIKYGYLQVQKQNGYSLAQIVQGNFTWNDDGTGAKVRDDYDPSQVNTYAMIDNTWDAVASRTIYDQTDPGEHAASEAAAMGTLEGTNRIFTIQGNGYDFSAKTADTVAGIGILDGQTLNLIDANEISGWKDYVADNAGTLNITGRTAAGTATNLDSAIIDGDAAKTAKTGVTNITAGSVVIGANGKIEQGQLNIADTATLNAAAGKLTLTAGIENSGELTLTDGTLEASTNGITGAGKTIISGDVETANAITQSALTIEDGKSLTMTGTGKELNISTGVANNGALEIGASELKSSVTSYDTTDSVTLNAGTLGDDYIISGGKIETNGSVSANVNSLKSVGGIINNDTTGLTLTGTGSLYDNISGSDGKTIIAGTIGNDNGKTITQNALEIASTGSLTTEIDKLHIGASDAGTITNEGLLTLTGDGADGDTLEEKVSSTGTAGNLTFAGANKITATGAITQQYVNADTDLDMDAVLTATATTLADGKTLEIDAGNLASDVTNGGTVKLGTGELAAGYTITGGKIVTTGDVTADADDLASTLGITNDNALTLKEGTLIDNIDGTGTTAISEDVEVAEGKHIANAMTVAAGKTLTIDAAGVQGTIADSGAVKLRAGTLADNMTISGTGTLETLGNIAARAADLTLSGGITNNNTLTLNGAGTLASDITGTAGKTIINGAGEVATSGAITQNALTIASGASLNMTGSGKALTVTNAIANNGTLTVGAGELKSNVTNNGTTNVTAGTLDSHVITGGDVELTGAEFNNTNLASTVNLHSDETTNATYKFNVTAINGTAITMDTIAVINQATGTLALGAIDNASVAISNPDSWAVGTSTNVQYLTGGSGNTIEVGNKQAFDYGEYRYTFEQQKTGAGETFEAASDSTWLKVTKSYAYKLWEVVRGIKGEDLSDYVLTGNYDISEEAPTTSPTNELGTLAADARTGNSFTIEGGGYAFNGTSAYKGIKVENTGYTLTLNDISEISGWNEYAVDNAGTLNIAGRTGANATTLNSAVKGAGTTNLTGNVVIGADGSIEQDELSVAEGAKFNADVDSLAISGGITNNGVMTLTGDNTTDTLNETVTGATGNLTFGGTNKITATGAITQQYVNVNANLDMNADLTAAVTVAEGSTLNMTSAANLKGDVANNGTVSLGTGTLGKTITGGDVKLTGTAFNNTNLAGELNLHSDETTHAVYNFAADITDGNPAVEKINVTGKATGVLNLGSIGVNGHNTVEQWNIGATKRAKYLTDETIAKAGTTLTVGNSVTVTSNGYKYDFSQGHETAGNTSTAEKFGWLDITKDNGYTLYEIVTATHGDTSDTYDLAKVNTYAIIDDAWTADGTTGAYDKLESGSPTGTLGTLTDSTDVTNREFTIQANGRDFKVGTSQEVTGIEVGTAQTLNLENAKEISGFKTYVAKNDGTLNIKGLETAGEATNLDSAVTGTGVTNITAGNVVIGANGSITQGQLNIAGGAALNAAADKLTLTAGIENSGELTLTDGTLEASTNGITGTGKTIISGDVETANAITQSALTIEDGKSLTMSGAGKELNISTSTGVANNGALEIGASELKSRVESADSASVTLNAGTLDDDYTIRGGAIVTNGSVEANADSLKSTQGITNANTLTLNGGTITDDISGAGTTKITGAVANGKTITQNALEIASTGSLDSAIDKLAVSTIANSGKMNLTGSGTLSAAVTGTNGKINYNGNLNINASVAGQTLNMESGELTIGASGETDGTDSLVLASGTTLNLQDNAIRTLTLKSLTAAESGAKIKFDTDLAGTAADSLTVAASSGKLELASVNVTSELAGPIETEAELQVVSGGSLGFTGSTKTKYGEYSYLFEGLDNGKVKVTKLNAYTLKEIVNNDSPEAGSVDTYSVTKNEIAETMDDDLGPLVRTDPDTERVLTINGTDGRAINGDGHKGIIVADTTQGGGEGDTLSLENVTMKNFAPAVTNKAGGVVKLKDAAFEAAEGASWDIVNEEGGVIQASGTNTFDKGIGEKGSLETDVDAVLQGKGEDKSFITVDALEAEDNLTAKDITITVNPTAVIDGNLNLDNAAISGGDIHVTGGLNSNSGTVSGKATVDGTTTVMPALTLGENTTIDTKDLLVKAASGDITGQGKDTSVINTDTLTAEGTANVEDVTVNIKEDLKTGENFNVTNADVNVKGKADIKGDLTAAGTDEAKAQINIEGEGAIGGNVALENAVLNMKPAGGTIGGDVSLDNGELNGGAITVNGGLNMTNGGTISGDLTILGGMSFKGNGATTEITGTVKAGGYLDFYLDGYKPGDTLVHCAGTFDLSGLTQSEADHAPYGIRLFEENGTKIFSKRKEYVTLMDNVSGYKGSTNKNTPDEIQVLGKDKALTGYNYAMYSEDGKLYAAYLDNGVLERAKAISEGRMAGMAATTSAGDLVADSMAETLGGISTTGSWESFADVKGSKGRYETGSHVDVNGITAAAGLGKRINDNVTLGIFAEGGNSRYTTYNEFEDFGEVRSDGDVNYFGGGVMAKVEGKKTAKGQLHGEASFRAGHMSSDYNSETILPGESVRYDTSTAYLGAHAAVGYKWNVKDGGDVDTYVKYLWTRQNGDSATLTTGEKVDFDAVDSHRIRTGVRYTSKPKNDFRFYAGLAYEYEFSNEAAATTEGMAIPEPGLKGGSGVAELGFKYRKANSPWQVELGVTGSTGKRDSIGANLGAWYEFGKGGTAKAKPAKKAKAKAQPSENKTVQVAAAGTKDFEETLGERRAEVKQTTTETAEETKTRKAKKHPQEQKAEPKQGEIKGIGVLDSISLMTR